MQKEIKLRIITEIKLECNSATDLNKVSYSFYTVNKLFDFNWF